MSDGTAERRYPAGRSVTAVTAAGVTPSVSLISPRVTPSVTQRRHPTERTPLLDPSRLPSPTNAAHLRAYANDVRSLIGDPGIERDARAAISQSLGDRKSIATDTDQEEMP